MFLQLLFYFLQRLPPPSRSSRGHPQPLDPTTWPRPGRGVACGHRCGLSPPRLQPPRPPSLIQSPSPSSREDGLGDWTIRLRPADRCIHLGGSGDRPTSWALQAQGSVSPIVRAFLAPDRRRHSPPLKNRPPPTPPSTLSPLFGTPPLPRKLWVLKTPVGNICNPRPTGLGPSCLDPCLGPFDKRLGQSYYYLSASRSPPGLSRLIFGLVFYSKKRFWGGIRSPQPLQLSGYFKTTLKGTLGVL